MLASISGGQMNRRGLLKRMPALPFAVGAAVSQGPQVVMRLFAGNPNELTTIAVSQEEIPMAERVTWFTQGVNGWLLSFRPNVAMPADDAEWTPAVGRAVGLWSAYIARIGSYAEDNRIPPDMAAEIAGVPETLLREVMH